MSLNCCSNKNYHASTERTDRKFASTLVYSSLLLIGFCLPLGGPASAWGQGFLLPDGDSFRMPQPRVVPIRRPVPSQPTYQIRELTIDAAIKDQIAVTQVTQVFQNPGDRAIQASFVFPLPYDGAVSEMTFLVDGKEYPAKLLPAEEARRIYEGYVRRNQDPALLEWVGTGMFQTSVFPIPPKATRTVTLKYSQLLRQQDRLVDYLFPLSTARYTEKPLDKLSLSVAIESSEKIRNLYSPTHLIDIQRDNEFNAVITHSAANVVPGTDFRLFFDTTDQRLGVSVVSYWPPDEDAGYFLLLASPELKPAMDQKTTKTVIFVVDRSGSMSGTKIQQAREAAKFIVNNLNETDLFNIITYDSVVNLMSPELLRFDEQSRNTALGFINSINAGGATNISDALSQALGMVNDDKIPPYIVFMTDGLPTAGEVNELKIAEIVQAANSHRARLLSFGVGYDVNSRLLDRLSRQNNGVSEYVRPDENLETYIARLYSRISMPVLSKVSIDYQFDQTNASAGTPVDRTYPATISDMFAGGQIIIAGRYRQSGAAKIVIKGEVDGQPQSFLFNSELAAKGETAGKMGDRKFIAQLWASRRIGEIIDLIDLNGPNKELIDELVMLSKKFGIITPYTSYLADDQADLAQLNRTEMMNQLTANQLQGLQQSGGRFAFSQRSSKQFFKDNSIASPGYLNQQTGEIADMGGGMGMGGGIGLGQGGLGGNVQQSTRGGGLTGGLGGQSGAGLGGSDAESIGPRRDGIRAIGSQILYVRGTQLIADNASDVDMEQQKDSITEIVRFSDPYFELVKGNSVAENQLLSLQQADEQLLVRLNNKVYLIK